MSGAMELALCMALMTFMALAFREGPFLAVGAWPSATGGGGGGGTAPATMVGTAWAPDTFLGGSLCPSIMDMFLSGWCWVATRDDLGHTATRPTRTQRLVFSSDRVGKITLDT